MNCHFKATFCFPKPAISSQANKKFCLCLDSLFNSLWWHIHDNNTNVCHWRVLLLLLLLSASAYSRIQDFFPSSHTQRLPYGTKLDAFQESQGERTPSGKTIKLRINNSTFGSTSLHKNLRYIILVFLSDYYYYFYFGSGEYLINTKLCLGKGHTLHNN